MSAKRIVFSVLVAVLVALPITLAQASDDFPGGKKKGRTKWLYGSLCERDRIQFWPVHVVAPLEIDIQTLVGNNHDTVLYLYRWNSDEDTPTENSMWCWELIAQDDDSGRGLGSRIVIDLYPGYYLIGVGSYQSEWYGSYRLRYAWKFLEEIYYPD